MAVVAASAGADGGLTADDRCGVHGGPLTNAEFHLFMNQPRRRERLHLLIYDLATGEEKILPFAECPKKEADSYSYEGWGTIFGYRKV